MTTTSLSSADITSDAYAYKLSANSRASPARWDTLTVVADKRRMYAKEFYFREALDDLWSELGDDAGHLLQRTALVAFKPDAVVCRAICPALDHLRAHRFIPAAAIRVRLDRRGVYELWRYTASVATLDRLALATEINTASDSLIVFFTDVSPRMELPAPVRLGALKGPAQPELRKPDHLRTVSGAMNRMFTHMHAADEPIDTVRELGILFESDERREIISSLAARAYCSKQLEIEIKGLYRDYAPADLELGPALARLRAEIGLRSSQASGAGAAALGRARSALKRACAGEPLPWRRFDADLVAGGVRADIWDRLTVGTAFLQHDVPGDTCLITDAGDGWYRGQGRLMSTTGAAWPTNAEREAT